MAADSPEESGLLALIWLNEIPDFSNDYIQSVFDDLKVVMLGDYIGHREAQHVIGYVEAWDDVVPPSRASLSGG